MLAALDKCTGCSACEQSCPVHAITMVPGLGEFLHPRINEDKCVSCGLCGKVCPVVNDIRRENGFVPLGFGCSLKDKQEVENSTSGGFFYALAKEVMQNGGVVYGAAMNEKMCVIHKAARTMEELSALRKSKYVQSDLGDIFPEIRGLLEQGMFVLFSGTPCQCAGLYSFLSKEYENLLLMEVFCAQITGVLTWFRYLEYLGNKKKSQPCFAGFREGGGHKG